jgi:NtrC-family two-component system sensor histidine kinase KinB
MRIKTKLTLGVGLLFAMILLLSLMGARYINDLKNDTENILVSNYNTLEYSRNMMLSLDEPLGRSAALAKFEENLARQQKNVTEIGEREATEALALHFRQWKEGPGDSLIRPLIRKDISEVMKLNMLAIQRKSDIAKDTAATATIWIAVSGTLCFLIAFVLLVNLPSNIAGPIKELTDSIKLIASKNYAQRVHFESRGEFGELADSFNVMAEKLEEYDNSNLSRLLMEKKRIETLINNMADPVIGLDQDRKVLFVNDEALKITGLKPADIIGKPVAEVAVTNDLVRSLVKGLIQPEHEREEKAPVKIYANNKESYFEKEIIAISITPTGEREKKNIGHVILLKNITPFKELDFAKTNFIATVSHELKTPIASIKMSLQLLQKESASRLNESQKQLLEGIAEDSDRLLKITGELLNMSQVETGNIQLNIKEVDPVEIVRFATDAVAFLAEQKGIVLNTEIEPGIPPVAADQEKTSWVLINFLTNAIRYTPGHTSIQVMVKRKEKGVLFSVQDSGRGIEERYKGRIFDRYFQVPGSPRTGTGLGLAISKEFIEAQGGAIGVDSAMGMGSTFYFIL